MSEDPTPYAGAQPCTQHHAACPCRDLAFARMEQEIVMLRRDMVIVRRQQAETEEERDRLRAALEAYEPAPPPMLEGETPGEYARRVRSGEAFDGDRCQRCRYDTHEIPDHYTPREADSWCACPCHQFEHLRLEALGWLRESEDGNG